MDVGETLAAHSLSAENMPAIYDASRGKPVLHDTALQLHVNYTDAEDRARTVSLRTGRWKIVPSRPPLSVMSNNRVSRAQCEVSGKVVGGLHVSARREQYEQLLDTLRWVSAGSNGPGPDEAAPAPVAEVRCLRSRRHLHASWTS